MAHAFLSDAWFEEAERIRGEINPPVPDAIKNIVVNLVVKNGPDGDVEARIQGGKFEKGLAAGAPTKLTVPYDVAKAMFISGDQQASMQAFMTGQIQVEGDMGGSDADADGRPAQRRGRAAPGAGEGHHGLRGAPGSWTRMIASGGSAG